MKEVAQGGTCPVGGNVYDLSVSPMKPKTTGTIYAAVRLDFPGNADDGKFWDTTSTGSWQASPAAWPTAAYQVGSYWSYVVPAAATTGKAGGMIVLAELTDNIAVPASSTVIAGGMEELGVVAVARGVSSVSGDVAGKVLGGGASVMTAAGVRAVDGAGNALATDAKQGTPAALAGGTATLAGMLESVAGTFAAGDDLHAIKAAIPSVSGLATATDVSNAVTAINGHTDSDTTGLAGGLSTISTNLDAKVSTRSTYAGGAATPSDVADAVSGYAKGSDITSAVSTIDGHTDSVATALASVIDGHTDSALAAVQGTGTPTLHTLDAKLDTLLVDEDPAGLYQITIHVQDPDGNPVEAVDVAIYDAVNAVIKTRKRTDSDGNYVLHRDAATYKVRMAHALYTFDLETLVVTDDASVTYIATPVVPIGMPVPGECLIYGDTRDASGALVDGVKLDFSAIAPQGVGDDVMVNSRVSVVSGPSTTNPNWPSGYFEVSLQRSVTVRVMSVMTNMSGLEFIVPDADSATLASLIEDTE
jgi:hypothetical protein